MMSRYKGFNFSAYQSPPLLNMDAQLMTQFWQQNLKDLIQGSLSQQIIQIQSQLKSQEMGDEKKEELSLKLLDLQRRKRGLVEAPLDSLPKDC